MDDEESVVYSSEEEDDQPSQGHRFVVAHKRGAVLRQAAGMDSEEVCVLRTGTAVEVIDRATVSGVERCRVVCDEQGGWLSSKCLEAQATECRAIQRLAATALILREDELERGLRVREGVLGGLDCQVVAVARQPRRALVLAHGAASSGVELVEAAKRLLVDFKLGEDTAVFLPTAPGATFIGGTALAAWWPPPRGELQEIRAKLAHLRILGDDAIASRGLSSDLEARRVAGVDEGVRALAGVLQAVSDATTLGPSHVWFGGFDQGATCALEVLETLPEDLRETPAGCVLVAATSFLPALSCGRLNDATHASETKILLAHGIDDTVVPIAISRAAATSLKRRGFRNIELRKCHGGHDINAADTLRAIAHFMGGKMASEDAATTAGATPEDEKTFGDEVKLLRAEKNRNLSFAAFKQLKEDRGEPTKPQAAAPSYGTKKQHPRPPASKGKAATDARLRSPNRRGAE